MGAKNAGLENDGLEITAVEIRQKLSYRKETVRLLHNIAIRLLQ